MKSLRFTLAAALILLSTIGFAQSDTNQTDAKMTETKMTSAPMTPTADAQKSEAQVSFDKLKTLAGSWEGRVTTFPSQTDIEGKTIQATLRVTSMGNAIMHEMRGAGRPDDPITMLYLDKDRLLLTHYCDAGNRPRMQGTISPDGKTVEFDFLDLAGGTQYGHMHHAVFTVVDE